MVQQQSTKKQDDEFSSTRFRIAEILVIVIMPLLYGAATRLPFMYFVIHLSDHFELDWLPIGLSVAAYQGSRVITSALAINYPSVSHILGTSAGLAGYITVFVSDKDSLAPFIAGTAIVGMSETMSSMQKYAKEMYKHHPDHKKTRLRMKYQYAFVMIGVMIAFFIGGFTYQHLNINGVAVLGIILEGLALIVVFIFLCLPGHAVKEGSTTSPSIVQENEKVNFPIKTPSHNNNDVIEVIGDLESGHADSNKHVSKQARKSIVSFDIPTTSNDEGQEEKDYEETKEDYYLNSSSAGSHTTDHDVLFTDEKIQDKAEKTKEGDTVDDEKEEFFNIDRASNDMDILTSETTTTTKGDDTERTSANLRRGSLFRRFSKQLSRMIITTNSEYPTCDLPATWVNWLLCFTFGIEALTIGYTLGIGPIFILTEFNKGTDIIGLFFSIGAAFGSISAILVTCTPFGSSLMKRIAAPPFDLCFAMGGIAMGVFIACVPSFTVHVIGLILLMCFNDLGATVMTELQASITTVSKFSLLGPLGQVIRRSLNVVTALTGPILFGINPRYPYYIAGSATLCWTMLLFILFKLRLEKTVEVISDLTGRRTESVKYRVSFATLEQLYSSTMVASKTRA